MNDTLFTLALNFSNYDNEKVGNIITKMAVIKESYHINIDELSKVLAVMGINELYVFSTHDQLKNESH
jgi:ADP-dependent phosphofructokinase/glucokinase